MATARNVLAAVHLLNCRDNQGPNCPPFLQPAIYEPTIEHEYRYR